LGKIVTTSTGEHGTTAITVKDKVRVVMQIVVSVVVLLTGLLVITSPNHIFTQSYDESTKKWAAGWVGAVVGYWLS
jgi:hypothetical protein